MYWLVFLSIVDSGTFPLQICHLKVKFVISLSLFLHVCTYCYVIAIIIWCSEGWTIYTANICIVQYKIIYAIEMCSLISCLVLTQLILTMEPVW